MPDEHGKMTEAEAIMEVERLGRELRESSSAQTAWYAARIGIAMLCLGVACLLMLFAYTVMSKSSGIPLGALLLSGLLIGGGVAMAWWGRKNSEPRIQLGDDIDKFTSGME